MQKNDVKICMHGDVHEARRELMHYWHQNKIHVIGAGSFGLTAAELPESTARLYNIIEIKRDLTSARVHTRCQPNLNGAWEGWYKWPQAEGKPGHLPYYDIDLK
jgi:isopentenyl phosphate kinase